MFSETQVFKARIAHIMIRRFTNTSRSLHTTQCSLLKAAHFCFVVVLFISTFGVQLTSLSNVDDAHFVVHAIVDGDTQLPAFLRSFPKRLTVVVLAVVVAVLRTLIVLLV